MWWTPGSAWNVCSNELWAYRFPASLLVRWRLSSGNLGELGRREHPLCCTPPRLGKSKGSWGDRLPLWSCTSSRNHFCNSSIVHSCLCLKENEDTMDGWLETWFNLRFLGTKWCRSHNCPYGMLSVCGLNRGNLVWGTHFSRTKYQGNRPLSKPVSCRVHKESVCAVHLINTHS